MDQTQPRRKVAQSIYRKPMQSPMSEQGPLPQQQALNIVPSPGMKMFVRKRMIAQKPVVGLI